MKFINSYKERGLHSKEEVFNYLINNLKDSNRTYDFFVDWSKAFQNVSNIEVELNIMNYLIGKDDIQLEFAKLIKQYPSIVCVIPILIAVREKDYKVLYDFKGADWSYQKYSFMKK